MHTSLAENLANILRCTEVDSDLRECAIKELEPHIEIILNKFKLNRFAIENIFIFNDNSAVLLHEGTNTMEIVSSLSEAPELVEFISANLKNGTITGMSRMVSK